MGSLFYVSFAVFAGAPVFSIGYQSFCARLQYCSGMSMLSVGVCLCSVVCWREGVLICVRFNFTPFVSVCRFSVVLYERPRSTINLKDSGRIRQSEPSCFKVCDGSRKVFFRLGQEAPHMAQEPLRWDQDGRRKTEHAPFDVLSVLQRTSADFHLYLVM